MLQVLTADLEKQAAELQDEELPVATPIINIPHISVRYCPPYRAGSSLTVPAEP